MSVLDGFRLDGKAALVTGGSKGLGRAMAAALAEAGAEVGVCSRTPGESKAAAEEIAHQTGKRVIGFEADVTDKESVRMLAEECSFAFGKVDVLVNNAGINVRKSTSEMPEEDWDSVMDISVKGSFLVSQALMPGMMDRRYGRIIMLGSIMSFVSIPNRAAYASAKSALLGLTRTLALEGAAHGVTVNCLCPGPFETEMNRPLMENPDAYAAFLAKIPMGRWGQPEELGGAVVFLASPSSALMTGTTLTLDGGWISQ